MKWVHFSTNRIAELRSFVLVLKRFHAIMHGPIKLKYQELISVFSQSHALFLMRLSTAFNFHISILYPVMHISCSTRISCSARRRYVRQFLFEAFKVLSEAFSEICLTFVAFFLFSAYSYSFLKFFSACLIQTEKQLRKVHFIAFFVPLSLVGCFCS
jgi:hypothetical protein